MGRWCRDDFELLPKRCFLTHGLEAIVTLVVETRRVGDLHVDAAETGVTLHDRPFAVIEADLVGGIEPVVEELGVIGLLELHALSLAAKLVLLENVVLRPRIFRDFGLVRANVRQEIVPGQERRLPPNSRACAPPRR